MLSGNDVFLEAMCLAIYAESSDAKQLLEMLLKIYEKYKKDLMYLNNEIVKLYIDVIKEIIDNDMDLSLESEQIKLLMKFEHSAITAKRPDLLRNLKTILNDRKNISRQRIEKLYRNVKNWILWFEASKITREMMKKNSKLELITDPLQEDLLLNEILESSKALTRLFETANTTLEDTIDFIDMTDKSSIKKAIESRKYTRTKENVFITGLKGLNRMFYPNNGIVRGESIVFMALSHHYKSGMLMNFARWIATYNEPPKVSGTPTIVFISLENEIYENLNQWFKDLYINLSKAEPDENMSDDDIIDYVLTNFSKNGYKLLVYRKIGDLFGYEEYIKMIEQLESEGHSIVATIIDYITLMRLPVGNIDNTPKKLQKLAHNLIQFNKHKLITTVSAIQLNYIAEEIASNETYVVKKFNNNCIADCKGLIREFDIATFMHIEENQYGERFLTLAKKKHRYTSGHMPENYRYPAFKFEVMGIKDDIELEKDLCVYDIHAEKAPSDTTEDESESILV